MLEGSAEGLNISIGSHLIENPEKLEAEIEKAVPIIKSLNRENQMKITQIKMSRNSLQQEIRMIKKDRDDLREEIEEAKEGINARLADFDKGQRSL